MNKYYKLLEEYNSLSKEIDHAVIEGDVKRMAELVRRQRDVDLELWDMASQNKGLLVGE